MTADGISHYDPSIERRGGDHEGNGQQRERRKPAVSCVLAQAGSGESESTRMCDPKHHECKGGGGRERADGIEIEAQPCIDLPELFPPLIVDDGGRDGPRAEQPVSYTHLTLPTSDLV